MNASGRPAPEPGIRVEIRGLLARADLNNKHGTITHGPNPQREGRIGVKIYGNTPEEKEHVWIRPANLLTMWATVEHQLYEPGTCFICLKDGLDAVTGPNQNSITMVCCGKECCVPCYEQFLDTSPDPDRCPHCRADTSDSSDEQIIRWLLARAERGEARAAHNLAVHYDYGQHGLARDEAEARKWYAVAAPGNAASAHNLAISHRDGQGGPRDYSKAAEYFQMAIDQNYVESYGYYGDLYRFGGPGLSADIEKAKDLWAQGAELGDGKCRASLQRLARREQR